MDELRAKLIKSIEHNGIGAIITIQLSQELDKLLIDEQRKKVKL